MCVYMCDVCVRMFVCITYIPTMYAKLNTHANSRAYTS